jgi:hypothetical protein
MSKLSRAAVWTNFFYLVPLAAAAYYGLWWLAASLAGLLVSSFAFHASREKRFVIADLFFAAMVVLLCVSLLLSAGLRSGYALVAALLVVAGLYIRYWLEHGRRGGVAHGLWHLIAAAVILSSIFSYAS